MENLVGDYETDKNMVRIVSCIHFKSPQFKFIIVQSLRKENSASTVREETLKSTLTDNKDESNQTGEFNIFKAESQKVESDPSHPSESSSGIILIIIFKFL